MVSKTIFAVNVLDDCFGDRGDRGWRWWRTDWCTAFGRAAGLDKANEGGDVNDGHRFTRW